MRGKPAKASGAGSARAPNNSLKEPDTLPSEDDESVKDFLDQIQFFPVREQIAARILLLNQKLGDSIIEAEFNALPPEDIPTEHQTSEVPDGWVDLVINRVSSLLFREESPPDASEISGKAIVSSFQKTISEKVYDRLGLLSLSPHAKQAGTFSLKEELTEGIAEDIGLGSYRRPEVPEELSGQVKNALFDLAREFQNWLVEECEGWYPAGWGEIQVRGSAGEDRVFSDSVVVWLAADVEMEDQRRFAITETRNESFLMR
jgi:hypothetical protein